MKERKAFLMRVDPGLWDDLESWAQDELRSVNGQIEMILRQAVQKRRGSKRQRISRSMKQEREHVSTR